MLPEILVPGENGSMIRGEYLLLAALVVLFALTYMFAEVRV